MTPAAYHRLAERGSMSGFFVRLASAFIAIAMLPLMISLCIEVYLLGNVILQRERPSAAVAVLLLIVFAGALVWLPFRNAPVSVKACRRSRNFVCRGQDIGTSAPTQTLENRDRCDFDCASQGGGLMLIRDFGERAVECVKLAERAHSEHDRELFIEMARAWSGLYEEKQRSSEPIRKPH